MTVYGPTIDGCSFYIGSDFIAYNEMYCIAIREKRSFNNVYIYFSYYCHHLRLVRRLASSRHSILILACSLMGSAYSIEARANLHSVLSDHDGAKMQVKNFD